MCTLYTTDKSDFLHMYTFIYISEPTVNPFDNFFSAYTMIVLYIS